MKLTNTPKRTYTLPASQLRPADFNQGKWQADVIKTARWLGVDPLQHAFNLDLNFSELEPGDLAALGYRYPPDQQQHPANQDDGNTDQHTRRDPLEAIALVLMYGASGIFMCVAAGYIWARWFAS